MRKNMTARATEANRRNAAKSTGPRTVEGKAAVSLNRLGHGLTGRAPLVPGEDPAEFERLRQGLTDQLAPQGVLEQALVDRAAGCLWRLWRIQQIEAGLLAYRRLDLEDDRNRFDVMQALLGSDGETDESRAWKQLQREDLPTWGMAFVRDCQSGALDKLSRYETSLERGLLRALHELERLQRTRAGECLPPPAEVDVTVDQAGSGGFEL
jgi:hypothetical protein